MDLLLEDSDPSGVTFRSAGSRSTADCAFFDFVEDCSDLTGQRITPQVIISTDGNAITVCGRTRQESSCTFCVTGGCTSSRSDEAGGSQTIYEVSPNVNSFVALDVFSPDDSVPICDDVCTQPDGSLKFSDEHPASSCALGNGYHLINDNYEDECVTALEPTCDEVEIVSGCAETQSDWIVKKYYPINPNPLPEDCEGRVDPNFPVYRALDDPSDNDVEGDYIYRSPGSSGSWRIRSVWWSSGAWCDEFPGTSGQRSSFDALEEPFLGLDGSISCLNGFYSRSYQYRSRDDLVIRCNRKRNTGGGSNNNGDGTDNNNINSGGGVIFVSPAPTRELSSASLFMSTMMLGLTTWFTL